MRRRLLVMRHAKSSWNSDAPSDHARPLNGRGRRDAPRVAARIRELGWTPDVVVTSDARRTVETFERMRDALGASAEPRRTEALYLAGLGGIRAEVGGLRDDIGTVLVLGHNPGWEEAVQRLCGEAVAMKTACVALLELDAENWRAGLEREGAWTLAGTIRPREL